MSDDPRARVIATGAVTGPRVQLIACTLRGVLLWDIAAHYNHAHPKEDRNG